MASGKFRGKADYNKVDAMRSFIIPFLPSAKKGGGKERDRALRAMQGVWVGVAVKIVSDEQERPTILGTARGLNITLCYKQKFQARNKLFSFGGG